MHQTTSCGAILFSAKREIGRPPVDSLARVQLYPGEILEERGQLLGKTIQADFDGLCPSAPFIWLVQRKAHSIDCSLG